MDEATQKQELKAATEKYLKVTAWWFLYSVGQKADDKKLDSARKMIERTEDFLRSRGVTDDAIQSLVARAEKFINTPYFQMTEKQKIIYDQLVWGPGNDKGRTV